MQMQINGKAKACWKQTLSGLNVLTPATQGFFPDILPREGPRQPLSDKHYLLLATYHHDAMAVFFQWQCTAGARHQAGIWLALCQNNPHLSLQRFLNALHILPDVTGQSQTF